MIINKPSLQLRILKVLAQGFSSNTRSNSEMNSAELKRFCLLDEETTRILKRAFDRFKLSARAYTRILKVARTIADLDNSASIRKEHITEAIQYRSFDLNK